MGSSTVKAQKLANETNLTIARETNALNRELATQQNQWNVEQWNRQNEYDRPANQVARMKEAGLSDAAAAQAASNFQSGQVQSADLANQQAASVVPEMDGLNIIDKIGAILSSVQSAMDVMQKGQALQHEEANFITSQDAQQWAIKQAAQDYMQKREMHPYSMQALRYYVNEKEFGLFQQRQAAELQRINIEKAQQELSFFRESKDLNLEKLAADLASVRASTAKTEAEKQRTEQQTEFDAEMQPLEKDALRANTENTRARTEGVKAATEEQKYQNILAKYGYPSSLAGKMSAYMAENEMTHKDIDTFLYELNDFAKTYDAEKVYNGKNYLQSKTLSPLTKKFIEQELTGGNSSFATDMKVLGQKIAPFLNAIP